MSLWGRPWFAYVGVLGHASSEFVAVLSGISGPEISSWRFLLGGTGLVLLALLQPSSRDLITPLKKDGPRLFVLSVLGVGIAYLFFHWALDFATVVQVAIVVTTIPVFVGGANRAINRQRIGTLKWVTGIAAIAGIGVLLTDGYVERLISDHDDFIGILMAVGCAALVAAYTVMVRTVVARHGALRTTALSMFIGGVVLWFIAGGFWQIWVNPLTLFERPAQAAYSLIAIALWNTTLTQYLWIGGLAHAPDITRASYLFFLKPVIAALLALLFLSQPVSGVEWLAIAVICGAVAAEFLWTLRRRKGGIG